MLMSRALWVPIAAATVLVGVLLSAPAFAQAHIRGTLTAANDGTISVQTAKGETVSIKLANDAGLFLVTKAEIRRSPSHRARRLSPLTRHRPTSSQLGARSSSL